MHFDYLAKVQRQESIDIENIGNCAIDVYNDLGFNWVLIIKTIEGVTHIIEFGPTLPDIVALPEKVIYDYDRIDFNEKKIKRIIDSFLNDYTKNVTQAFEIGFEEAKSKIRNLVDYICL